MPSFNDHFIENTLGKPIAFNVQPYARGAGIVKSMTPRIVEANEFDPEKGRTLVKYEVYDIVVACTEGSETGALAGGVPVAGTTHSLKGKDYRIVGCSYGNIRLACHITIPAVLVQARCG